MATLDVFDIFSRDYARERFESMSLRDWLLAARDDKMLYATPAERMVAAIGEPELVDTAQDPRLGRMFFNRTHQGLSRLRWLLRHGGHDRADRGLLQARRPGPRREAPDSLSAGPGRRRQILARRAAQGADGEGPDLRAQGGRRDQPGVRIAAGAVPLRRADRSAGREVRHREAPPRRRDEPVGRQAARRIRRRHLEIRGGAHLSVQAAPDRHRQDRAGRREQPGHLLARRQGRHPQARAFQPERSGRLFLLRRPVPRQPGPARIRRDVQGADQGAAPAADRHPGRQLHRHRDARPDPVLRHHPGALQRSRMDGLQGQQEQRGLPRPHLRHHGALLPARHRRDADLQEAAQGQRAGRHALRARDAGDAGEVLRDDAAQGAREFQSHLQDARL